MAAPVLSAKMYAIAYLSVLLLLAANVGIGYLDLGWGNMFMAVTIATFQAAIMSLVLMHGLYEKPAVRIAMGGAVLWFMILITLTMTDYITRNWVPVSGK